MTDEVEPKNLARGVSRAGFLLGLALMTGAVVEGAVYEGGGWRGGLPWAGAFAAVGVVLLLLGAALANVCLLGRGIRREIARGNLAAGLVSAGHFVAIGLVLDACFYGRDLATLVVSGTFFLIAVATLLVLQLVYRLMTRYQDDQEIRGENLAAALGYVGLTLAFAVIVGHAAEGTFLGWARSLRAYGLALLLAVALYPVRQLVVGSLLLGLPARVRGGALDRLIAQERNEMVGAIEAVAYVAAALLATGLG